jgi:hypothetical protein
MGQCRVADRLGHLGWTAGCPLARRLASRRRIGKQLIGFVADDGYRLKYLSRVETISSDFMSEYEREGPDAINRYI